MIHALTAKTKRNEPLTNSDAITSLDALSWKQAMEEEMSALDRNHTWTLTNLPSGRSAVKCRWIYKLKLKVQKVTFDIL